MQRSLIIRTLFLAAALLLGLATESRAGTRSFWGQVEAFSSSTPPATVKVLVDKQFPTAPTPVTFKAPDKPGLVRDTLSVLDVGDWVYGIYEFKSRRLTNLTIIPPSPEIRGRGRLLHYKPGQWTFDTNMDGAPDLTLEEGVNLYTTLGDLPIKPGDRAILVGSTAHILFSSGGALLRLIADAPRPAAFSGKVSERDWESGTFVVDSGGEEKLLSDSAQAEFSGKGGLVSLGALRSGDSIRGEYLPLPSGTNLVLRAIVDIRVKKAQGVLIGADMQTSSVAILSGRKRREFAVDGGTMFVDPYDVGTLYPTRLESLTLILLSFDDIEAAIYYVRRDGIDVVARLEGTREEDR